MKTLFTTCFLITICFVSHAQHRNIYYLLNNGKHVSTKDSADYIRIVTEPDSINDGYILNEYYKNGKLKRVGHTLELEWAKLDGQVMEFYETGKRKTLFHYNQGLLNGERIDFFPNGAIYTTTIPGARKLISCYDTTGKKTVENGKGHYIVYSDDFNTIESEGEVLNGLMNGEWKGYQNKKLAYLETYKNDNLVSGISYDELGKSYPYTQISTYPVYRWGINNFFSYVQSSLRRIHLESYSFGPTVQIKVSFYVEENGKLTDVKILESPFSEKDSAEIISIFSRSPFWTPGTRRGKPARIFYTFPLILKMPS